MAEFSFDEFVNVVKNIDVKSDNKRKEVILHLTLDAMDRICPNSYMPFVFMYAASNGILHFSIKESERYNIPDALTLSYKDFKTILKGNNIIKELLNLYEPELDVQSDLPMDKYLAKIMEQVFFEDLLSIFDNDKTCFWDFRYYLSDDPKSDYYYPINENPQEISGTLSSAIKTLETTDPFFLTTFDKASYFILIGVAKNCLIEKPNDDESFIQDIDGAISFYGIWNKWYNYYDNLVMHKHLSQTGANYQIPDSLTRIVNGLLMNTDTHNLYDPFCSMGLFALNVNAQMSNYRNHYSPREFFACSNDNEIINATTVRLLFRGCPVIWHSPKDEEKRNTYYVALPSLVSVSSNIDDHQQIVKETLCEGLEYASIGSKMVCIVPSSALVSEAYSDIMKRIIESEYEVKIVSLPKETIAGFNTAISIIFVDGSVHSDSIKFVDGFDYVSKADKEDSLNAFDSITRLFEFPDAGKIYINYTSLSNLCFHDEYPEEDEETHKGTFQFGSETWNAECSKTDDVATDEFGDRKDFYLSKDSFDHDIRIISKSDIIANGTLNPSYYFNRPVVAPTGYEVCRLSEVLTPDLQTSSSPCEGKVVSSKDLRNVGLTYEVNVQSLPIQAVPEGSVCIEAVPKIVMSKLGMPRPSLINVAEKVYADDATLYVFNIISSKANADFLINEMRKDNLEDQISSANIERGILKHRRVTLDALKIYLPLSTRDRSSLEVQKDKVEEELTLRLNDLSEKYQQLNDQRFNEYIMALRQRKHRLAQILNQVCPAFSLLNKTREKNDGVLKDADVVASRTGENVAQYFSKVQQGLDKIERLIDTFVDKSQWGKAEMFALEDFVSEFTQKHICKNYKIQLSLNNISDVENVDNNESLAKRMLNMPKDELSTVFENIIANAETWGFNDRNRDDYVIKISLGDMDNGEQVVITIANNGTPIHPSVDRNHIFDWGVGNHTGVGTWQAKNIVEHYEGHIRINEYPNAKDGFKTEYELTLPREY